MFDNLSGKLTKVLRFLKGEATLTEDNMQQALREIRLSLLEADVNFKVVKQFVESIRRKLLGKEVRESLNPYQHVVKIVHDELMAALGQEHRGLNQAALKPSIVMLTGLQGAGKTTSAGKLGLHLKEAGKTALLGSLDLKRLAAVEQLEIIARETGLAFYRSPAGEPKGIARDMLQYARDHGHDYLIVDTAGRLHIDDELMAELQTVKALLQPVETIFVADSLTGQDAVNSAQAFAERVGIDSIILTKLDADSRGGAALSIATVTGKPIKFAGVGEKYTDFQVFFPDRMASKILGMGDVLTLIEKAEKQFDEKQAEVMAKKMLSDDFSLDDFADQMRQVEKLGSLGDIMGMLPNLPGMNMQAQMANGALDDRKIRHTIAIISSMTRRERQNPKLIDGRRRLRIARGSGRPVQEINQLLRSYQDMKKYMKTPLLRKMLKRFDFS
jgi:signal recognition particle subunit SRP54